MKFEIGKPDNGWVSVCVETGSDRIEFDASDVPNDPISCLIEAIRCAAAGRESSVWWHLEPSGFYFDFEPIAEGVRLRVLHEPGSDRSKAKVRAVIEGSISDILLPLWRGLQQFEAYGLSEPHWPTLEPGSISSLWEMLDGRHARG